MKTLLRHTVTTSHNSTVWRWRYTRLCTLALLGGFVIAGMIYLATALDPGPRAYTFGQPDDESTRLLTKMKDQGMELFWRYDLAPYPTTDTYTCDICGKEKRDRPLRIQLGAGVERYVCAECVWRLLDELTQRLRTVNNQPGRKNP